MMYDLKKLEEKFREFYEEGWEWRFYERNEIEITEALIEQQEAIYIPMGFLSYFLVIEDEKPVLYVAMATRFDTGGICLIDEDGYECYDVNSEDHKEIGEKYRSHLQKVKKFKGLKEPKRKKK